MLLARLHDNIAQGKTQGLPRLDEVPAFGKLPFGGVLPDSSLELLYKERSSVEDVMRVLGADH